MRLNLPDLWSWRGTVGRGRYVTLGTVLFAVKHNVDRFVASAVFDQPWSVFNYWMPSQSFTVAAISQNQLSFYGTLVAISSPFIWTGVVLTLRRLRDADLPLWFVTLFFVPIVHLFFFLLLSVLPSRTSNTRLPQSSPHRFRTLWKSIIPDSQAGSAAMGILLTLPLALIATEFSVRGLGNYGWGLFVGLPFFLGLTSVLVYSFHRPRSLSACLMVSLWSITLFGVSLIALAIEGVICVVRRLCVVLG